MTPQVNFGERGEDMSSYLEKFRKIEELFYHEKNKMKNLLNREETLIKILENDYFSLTKLRSLKLSVRELAYLLKFEFLKENELFDLETNKVMQEIKEKSKNLEIEIFKITRNFINIISIFKIFR